MQKVIILLLLCNSVWAVDIFPPPFTAKYSLYASGIPVGEGTRTLIARGGGKFEFESIGETNGLISIFKKLRIEERTKFIRIEGKIRPLEYFYNHTGKKSKLKVIVFDWLKKIATSSFEDKIEKIPLEEDTLDGLLYQVVLMQELQQGKRKLKYKVANKNKISVYTPKFLGKEFIDTGVGKLETLKYERASSNRSTILWCAPKLHYLPVQVQHTEKNGDVFSMLLQSVKGL